MSILSPHSLLTHYLKRNSKILFKSFSLKDSLIKMVVISMLFFNGTFGQCLTSPAFPGCFPASGSPLADGDVINTGTIKTVNNISGFSGVTLSGGQLIICGNLTVSNLTINSGTIFVNTGGVLNCPGGSNVTLNSGSGLYNNGTVSLSGHLVLNANTTIVNNGTLSTPFNYLVIQGLNAFLVNNGVFTSGGIMAWLPSSPGCLCLGDRSATTTNYFYNKTANSVSVPVGEACLNVKQYAANDYSITANAGLDVCIPSGISYSGVPNWGNARIINPCVSCSVVLPIELIHFDGYIANKNAVITWQTISENNNCSYEVERSVDGISFMVVGTVGGAINSLGAINYQIIDNTIEPDIVYYYRLKQEDCTGIYSYSQMISLSYESDVVDVEFIKETMVDQTVELYNHPLIQNIYMINSLGQIIYNGINESKISLANLPDGMFYIHIVSKSGKSKTYKILKNPAK